MRHVYRRHCSKVVTAAGQERVLSTVEVGGSDEGEGGEGREGSSLLALAYTPSLPLSSSVLRIGDLISLDNADLRNGENISTEKNGPLKKEWTRGNVVGPAS